MDIQREKEAMLQKLRDVMTNGVTDDKKNRIVRYLLKRCECVGLDVESIAAIYGLDLESIMENGT